MKNVFDPEKTYSIPLYGHAFTVFPHTILSCDPVVPGHFEADTVEVPEEEVFGGITEYAVFTVEDPTEKAYSYGWAGTYRIPVELLRDHCPDVFEE